ncbi:MAG: T9SS type A sorting domain-containing protein [Bacteroidales bacterium]|nr:T9SS type A sorting domain-containing protein [Bacteroidales bacterium]
MNTDAEIGNEFLELNNGNMYVVPNPFPDDVNSSDYVLKQAIPEGVARRAEYSVSREETNEKRYIYTWKRFHPTGMLIDVDYTWLSLNQWKTWPCEAYPVSTPGYEKYGDLICPGGGIFNEMQYEDSDIISYKSRALPNCNSDYFNLPEGYWHQFVLEIYWTNTENGYYRLWKNDSLVGYSDNIKTLFDHFIEGTCDIYWATGLYSGWYKTGNEKTDSIISYIDDVTLYDVDSGYTINSVCPDCEVAPSVPTDSSIYKINVNYSSSELDGYNNYIVSWDGDTSAINISNTFGQSKGIDIYLPSNAPAITNNTLGDDCFPDGVITTHVGWSDTVTRKIYLKDLNPDKIYTFKLLGATSYPGTNRGTQLWTTEENRDTVLAANNICNVAELTNLVSDENGDLTINVKSIDYAVPEAYINSIEIVEYIADTTSTSINSKFSRWLNIFPNPVKYILIVKGEAVPTSVTIYDSYGRKVKYAENTNTVNISDLKKGMYIVLVNTKESFLTRKIIKE